MVDGAQQPEIKLLPKYKKWALGHCEGINIVGDLALNQEWAIA